MFTENGRYKRSDSKETSYNRVHTYKCMMCSTTIDMKKVEFGEKVLCPECGSIMAPEHYNTKLKESQHIIKTKL